MKIDDQTKPLVSIVCLTYNHVDYISRAISGFLSQETNFDFEIFVSDDASTDGTSELLFGLCDENPGRIDFQLNTSNMGMQENLVQTLRRVKGKYIAICDGDDYWLDNNKLQKQTDLLEAEPDVGVVFTGIYILPEFEGMPRRELVSIATKKGQDAISYQSLLLRNQIYTCTAMFRKKLLDNHVDLSILENHFVGDYPLWLEFSNHSNIAYIEDKTAVYSMRDNTASISGSQSSIKKIDYINKLIALRDEFIKKFPIDDVLQLQLDVMHSNALYKFAYEGANLELMQSEYRKLGRLNGLKFWHKILFLIRGNNFLRNNLLSIYRYISRLYGISAKI